MELTGGPSSLAKGSMENYGQRDFLGLHQRQL